MRDPVSTYFSRDFGWQKHLRKTVYTLNISDYSPQICALTYPLIAAWAKKIGAEFHVIKERKYPDWPVVYEKLQIFELAKGGYDPFKLEHVPPNDWSIYIDSDTLVHPDCPDWTEHIQKDTVAHNGKDFANLRWRYDQYFRRDGRNLGSCDWFAMASDLCLDLWRPLEDLTLDQALQNIFPTVGERNCGIVKAEHLIDDYTLSRNIAKFGLKHTTLMDICGKFGFVDNNRNGINPFFFHIYTVPEPEKHAKMLEVLKTWKVL